MFLIYLAAFLTSWHQSRPRMRGHHVVVRVDMWMVVVRVCMRMAVAVVVVRSCHVAVMWHSNLVRRKKIVCEL